MKSYMKKKEEVQRKCFLLDAQDKVLGRLATKIAQILSGKDQPTFTPYVDSGNTVIVVNADKIRITGKKMQQKVYKRYSGYPDGLKLEKLESLMKRRPTEVLRTAVKGMLPKNKLQRDMIRRLKVYPGGQHPHQAQKPQVIQI